MRLTKNTSQFLFGSLSFIVVIITDYFSRNIHSELCAADFSKYLKDDMLPAITSSTYITFGTVWLITAFFIIIIYLLFKKSFNDNIFIRIEIIYIGIRPVLILAIMMITHFAKTLPLAQLSNMNTYYKIAFITIDNIKFVKSYGLSISYIPIIALCVSFVYHIIKKQITENHKNIH